MLGILAPLGIAAAKFAGAHLVAAHLTRGATGAANTFEAAATGLGMRFALGFGTAYYFTNPEFRRGVKICFVAIKDSIF